MENKNLGLIAGNGHFPILFSREAKSQNYSVIAAGIKGDTSFFLRFFVDKMEIFKVGELKRLFTYFRDKGIKQVIMAGQVNPDNLFSPSVKLDDEFQSLFDAMKNRKADTIFSAVADKLGEYDLELMDSTFLLKDYLAPPGVLTRRAPSAQEKEDIVFGREIAKAMGQIDVGQTVVVKEKAIVAIEAMEGTDQAILRGGCIARRNAVVVKMSKPNQDLRFDIPVVGLRTIKNMVKVKASCLAIEAGKTLLLQKDQLVKCADQANITIFSV